MSIDASSPPAPCGARTLIRCGAQIHFACPVTFRNFCEYVRSRCAKAAVKTKTAAATMVTRRIRSRSDALIESAAFMRSVIVIPARWASTRFPGKPLAPIAGVSLIRRVYERAVQSKRASAVYVATDDDRIESHVQSFGGRVLRPE